MTIVGTDVYRAPEIFECADKKQLYTDAVDIYSVGILILWLLGPRIWVDPIHDQHNWTKESWRSEVFSKIEAAARRAPPGEVQDAVEAAHLMLRWRPEERPSAAACFQIPWLRDDYVRPAPIDTQSVSSDSSEADATSWDSSEQPVMSYYNFRSLPRRNANPTWSSQHVSSAGADSHGHVHPHSKCGNTMEIDCSD